jgi:hypothetical protein
MISPKKIFIFSLFVLLLLAPSVSAAWWNSSWSYRVDNAIPNGARPYQISLNLSNATGTNNATTIFCNGKCNVNFSDVRFTLDNTTLLPYWINNTNVNQVFVNVTTNGTVNMYYGNPSSTSTSNVNTTFILFDDFENGTGKWTPENGGFTLSSASPKYGVYSLRSAQGGSGSGNFITAGYAGTNITNFVYEGWAKPTQNDWGGVIFRRSATTTFYILWFSPTSAQITLTKMVGAARTDINSASISGSLETWYRYKIFVNGNSIKVYIDDVLKFDETDTAVASGFVGLGGYNEATNRNIALDNVFVKYFTTTEPQWTTWGGQSSLYSNNKTNDASLNVSELQGKYVRFYYNDTTPIWLVDSVNQTASYGSQYLDVVASGIKNITVYNISLQNSVTWNYTDITYPFQLISPANGSTGVSNPVTLFAREWARNDPYTFTIATDSQFINNVSSGSLSCTNENCTTSVSLSSSTKYWWIVKNGAGIYSQAFNFTTSAPIVVPGQFNITLLDEINISYRIMNFSIVLKGADNSYITKNSNLTTGWANFSGAEVSQQEYLIIATSTGWAQRMVVNNSPGNVTMYLPNTSLYTIDVVSFTLLDVTGLYPFQTSKLVTTKGGTIQDSSYFSADSSHVVNMIRGQNYGMRVVSGNNIFDFQNYNSVGSGSVTISINDFKVYPSVQMPFVYNISYSTNNVELHWNDSNNAMQSLNFTVRKNTSILQCNILTSVDVGQSICGIDSQSSFYIIFSAKMEDGTFKNTSFTIDYRNVGKPPDSLGTSRIDGSLIGTGYKISYTNSNPSLGLGTYTIPQDIKNIIALLLIVLLAAEFGAAYAGLGGVLVSIMALFFEYYGLFRPFNNDTTQFGLMALTGGIAFMTFLYYMQHKDKYG